MKYYILLSMFFSSYFFSQHTNRQRKIDSLALNSRNAAENVLYNVLKFKNQDVIVFSTSDQSFIVIKKNYVNKFDQFYVRLDYKNNLETSKQLRIKKKYLKLLDKSFDSKNYKLGFIKTVENPIYENGTNSYFVMKDKLGNRYGEYYLPALINPSPIGRELYGYLINILIHQKN